MGSFREIEVYTNKNFNIDILGSAIINFGDVLVGIFIVLA